LIIRLGKIGAEVMIRLLRLINSRQLAGSIADSRRRLSEGRHHENLKFLKGAVLLFPDSGEIRLLYGIELLTCRPREALSEIAKAAELEPGDPVLLIRAAHTMFTMKQFDHARSYMNRVKSLAPEDFLFGPELLNLESNFAALDGEDDRAEEGLRLAVKREPRMEPLAVDLAKFLADRGRRAEALTVIDEAMTRTKGTTYLERLRAELLADSSATCSEVSPVYGGVDTTGSKQLDPVEHQLLEKAVRRWCPQNLRLVELVGARTLSEEEREALRGALAYELTASGLREDDEPNAYGLELDDLIGKLADF
jgi:tetratricopeptide (TPR) repeat protein